MAIRSLLSIISIKKHTSARAFSSFVAAIVIITLLFSTTTVNADTFTAGVTTTGTGFDSSNVNMISSTQVTTGATSGTLSSISVYVGTVQAAPSNQMQVAIYADTGSNTPGNLLASSAGKVLTANAWNTFSINAITVAANTKYWLAFNVNGSKTKYAIQSSSSARSAWRSSTTFGTWPGAFGTPTEPISQNAYSIYMTYTSGSAPTATPIPTATPTPTGILTPTATPTPTIILSPTPTGIPTPTPTSNPSQFSYVASVSSNGRYFRDQNGAPILIKGDSPWALISDLSTAQVEQWAADRQSFGFNAAIVSLIGAPQNGGDFANGATYDGIAPFNNGDITSWNEAYWSRVDQDLTILENHGITVFLFPMDGWTTLKGNSMYHQTAAASYTFGQMVANRYKNYPNIMWMAGGDYQYYDDPKVNTEFQNMLAGIRSTGDTRPFSIEHTLESVSTDVPAYEPISTWNWGYSYSMIYEIILRGYEENISAHDPRPVLLGESNYEGTNNTGGPNTTNETLRRQILWALTSGAAGEFSGTQDWLFYSGWQGRLDDAWATQEQKLRTYWQSLDNWQLLVPDDKNHVVTAGRGTQIMQDSSLDVLQNNYVTAAQTPDKSVTVVYVPTDTGDTNARTITLDLTKLPASYTATWVDPTDATQSQPAIIDVSGNVTTPGLHADGTRDWLLVIHN